MNSVNMSLRSKYCHLVIGLLLVCHWTELNCVTLDPDGGYHIVVGISEEDRLSEIPNQVEFMDNLKGMLTNFSAQLWETTNHTFYIKTTQILLPTKWGSYSNLTVEVATKATYAQSDIQIMESTSPRTETFYPCGRPGVRILLPEHFIAIRGSNGNTDALYGSQAKALVQLWLRYRFGVWEEHGYPHHNSTPYMYNEDDINHSEWLLTSCTNVKLNGRFEYRDVGPRTRSDDESCDTKGSAVMPAECLFVTDSLHNSATSSILNFQWVKSITKLCDENTHNKVAPNRQNLYCQHKSVWEVIRQSEDFKSLGNKGADEDGLSAWASQELPEVAYRVVTPPLKPLLYILLANGSPDVQHDDDIYKGWLSELQHFIDDLPSNSDFVTTLVAYSTNPFNNKTQLTPYVDWTILDPNSKEDIKFALDFGRTPQLPPLEDLRVTLAAAVSQLKSRGRPRAGKGTVLLMLRTENSLPFDHNYHSGGYEQDFILDFKTHGITLCAIEINLNPNEERFPLKHIVDASGGLGVVLRPLSPPSETMRPVLEFVRRQLVEEREYDNYQETDYEIIYKEGLNFDFDNKSIRIPKRDNIETLYIHITLSGDTGSLDEVWFQSPEPESPFAERIEWNYRHPPYLRNSGYTYSKTVQVSTLKEDGFLTWELYLAKKQSHTNYFANGMVLIYGSKSKTTSRHSNNNITGEVFTSARDNKYFECSSTEINEEPLAIYAKLLTLPVPYFEEYRPLILRKGPNSNQEAPVLTADLYHIESGSLISVRLNDSGVDADLLVGDGVYSGYVYPSRAGTYRIFVTLYDMTNGTQIEVETPQYPIGGLTQATQNHMQTNVTGRTLNSPYSLVIESPNLLHVNSPCMGKRHIGRVLDTQVEVTQSDAKFVRLTFTVPSLTSSEDVEVTGHEYETYLMGMARFSPDMESLIDDPDAGRESMQMFLIPLDPPGRKEVRLLDRGDALVFTFELLDFRQPPTKSLASNIARVKGWPAEQANNNPDDKNCIIGCTLAFGIGGGLIIGVLLIILLAFWKKSRTQQAQLDFLTRDEVKEFLHGHQKAGSTATGVTNPNYAYAGWSEIILSLPYDSKYEIPSNKLHIDRTELLGSGAFGNVYKGYVVNMVGTGGKVLIVAVKTMKPNMDKSCFKALLSEVKLMTHIGSSHPNIVKLVGACTKNIRKCEVFLATEFCVNGNLSSYLLKLNKSNFRSSIDDYGQLILTDEVTKSETELASTWTLIKWGREIANGMTFLGQKKIVHGDLAARNILLDSDLVAKISDFGLSKQMLQNYSNYNELMEIEVESGGLLPWKWLAPEALAYMRFSVTSDVWAYGVTIWEIFTLGQVPYPGVKWNPDFVSQLEKEGIRLGKPEFATATIYEVMAECWKLEQRSRIAFSQIKTNFDQMLAGRGIDQYLKLE